MNDPIYQLLTRRLVQEKPYKGSESYYGEDRKLFFGRDREDRELSVQIMSSPVTVMFAPSGAGKTSIINTGLVPALLSRGYTPVVFRPQHNPLRALRFEIIRGTIPHPEVEWNVVEAIIQSRSRTPGAESSLMTIQNAIDFFDSLDDSDTRRRAWVAPFEYPLPVWSPSEPALGWTMSIFSLVLLGDVPLELLTDYLNALCPAEFGEEGTVKPDMTLSDFKQKLESVAFRSAYQELLNQIDTPGSGLVPFMRALHNVWGTRVTPFTPVLILDQFEEFFTLFVHNRQTDETGTKVTKTWHQRDNFFAELERLHFESFGQHRDSNERGISSRFMAGSALPMRIVVSMREEYIAQLDKAGPFLSETDSLFHLDFIDSASAAEVIHLPAMKFGYTYSPECYDKILADLTREDRYIEPAHVQIVCDRLWEHSKEELDLKAGVKGDGSPLLEIDLETFENPPLNGTKGILEGFFDEFIKDFDDQEQFEILEMLTPLITSSGTRNIVELSEMIDAPFRQRDRRKDLIEKLQRRNIIRIEGRLGGYFSEITHEFLIKPIRKRIRKDIVLNRENSLIREALISLGRIIASRGHQDTGMLREDEFSCLNQNRARLDLREAAALMLSHAIFFGEDNILYWAREHDKTTSGLSITSLCRDLPERKKLGAFLKRYELDCLRGAKELNGAEHGELAFLLESTIQNRAQNRLDLKYWYRLYSGCIPNPGGDAILQALPERNASNLFLDSIELNILKKTAKEGSVSGANLLFVLQSSILRSAPWESEEVKWWARKAVKA